MPGESAVAPDTTDDASQAVADGKALTHYVLTAADGTKVMFGSWVAAASPVTLTDYLNESVTIVGTGRMLDGRSVKSVKVVYMSKITSVTKNEAPQPATRSADARP